MSNDDILQVQDLKDGKLDITSIAQVAMIGTNANTVLNRDGVLIDTLQGRLNKLGLQPPIPYASGITFTDATDSAKTIDTGGVIYGVLGSSRPFTTSGNFQNDLPNFYVVQNTGAIGNVRTDQDNIFIPGTTQTIPKLIILGVNVGEELIAQAIIQAQLVDDVTANAASAASAESAATSAQSTANTANDTANANADAIAALSLPSLYVTSNGKLGGVNYRAWSDGTVEQWASSVLRTGGDSANQIIALAIDMPNSSYEIQTSYDSGVGDRSPLIADNRAISQFSVVFGNNNTTFSWSVRSS